MILYEIIFHESNVYDMGGMNLVVNHLKFFVVKWYSECF